MKNLDKNGFLKSEKICFFTNLTGLILNILSLGGILTAISIDKVDPEAALTTAAISLGVGAVGVATAIATEIAESRLEKRKAQAEAEKSDICDNENTTEAEICDE